MPLTSEGLVTRRFEEILADLVAAEQINIDPNIDARDDELLGQINNIIALIISDLEQVTQAVMDNLNIDQAEGVWLDKLAAEKGLQRQAASKSTSTLQHLIGTDGTIVPADTILKSVISDDEYIVTEATTISLLACQASDFTVNTVLDTTSYTVTVNSVLYDYTSDGTATAQEIVDGLKALIDVDGTATWSATVVGTTLTITTDDINNLAIATTTYLSSSNVTVFTTIEAVESGEKVDPAGTITIIVSTVPGFAATTNTQDVVSGRELETDEEFRVRTIEASQVNSVATLPAITSRLRNIQGVDSATVIENETDSIDGGGRPGHSYESIIVGGDDDDIAQDLWESKPAGIALFGTTTVLINDSEGQQRSIKFTRPAVINLAFRVTYSAYDEEELPSDPEAAIQEAVVETTEALEIGEDVIPSRYFGPIYSGVSGIDSLVVEVQQITDPGDTPNPGSWQTTKLAIAETEFGNTITTDIEVVAI